MSPDGTYVAVAGYQDGRALVYDVAGRSVLPSSPASGTSGDDTVAISSADVMIGATDDGLLVRYDPRTLEQLGRLPGVTKGDVHELVFDGSGDLLAVRRPNGSVTVVDVATGTELGQPLSGQAGHLGGGHISLRSDGEMLSVPADGGTSMWQLSPKVWVEAACRLAGRELTETERDRHLDGQGDRTCGSAVAS